MAVKEVICDNEKERFQFEEALLLPTHWKARFLGGEPELLHQVLSMLCCQPIVVYIPQRETLYTSAHSSSDSNENSCQLHPHICGRGAGSFRFIQAPIRFSNATAGASSTQCFCKDSKYEGTFRANVECAICQAKQEDLSVHESNHFRSIVPFEIWIIPRKHSSHFHDIDPDMTNDLGGVLKLMLGKMSLQLK
ncbi:ADP-glucose phosphorylase-like [Salvia hispanica]|uniref:ADP-glucose phosphorylase-like n=1 Tax=Salvia hispanica TaxID=49212 RepID=UPI002009541F|nr:ADP-glucose phosphorylase-like [Salvia hispanica]